MKASMKKVQKLLQNYLVRKISEKQNAKKRKSFGKSQVVTESQIWRSNIEKLCKEMDESFERRKLHSLDLKWNNCLTRVNSYCRNKYKSIRIFCWKLPICACNYFLGYLNFSNYLLVVELAGQNDFRGLRLRVILRLFWDFRQLYHELQSLHR